MEKVGEISQPKKVRINWNKEGVVKTFLESCLHEISINGLQGGCLKMHSWKKVAETLQKTHNFIVDQRQMKNHYDYLKGKYGAWAKLKNRTGNVYDPSTNTFNLSEEEWQAEMKLNKYVEKLRSAPLSYPELCVQLFDGVACTGVGSWGPSANVPNPTRVATVNVEDLELNNTQQGPNPEQGPPLSIEEDSARPQPQRKKRKGAQTLNSVNREELAEVVTHVKHIFDKQPEADDMDACIEKLEKLGWEQNPLYEVVLFLFSQGTDYRKLWLCLKDERCEVG